MTRNRVVFVIGALLGAVACVSPLPAASAGNQLAGKTFVVDPGHALRSPSGDPLNVGAQGPHGVTEMSVALAVGTDLATLLQKSGATVVMTRTYAQPWRVGTNKNVDNRARAALANKLHATAFIAIHCDSSLDPAQGGTSVFWLRPNSTALANNIRTALRPLDLGESQFRARDLAVTNEAVVPAVLVELGFVSNPAQEHLLADPAFQQREARALYDALLKTFGRSSALQ